MKRTADQPHHRQATRIRVGAWCCLLLGVFWAASPVVHGVFHLAHVSHRHSAGSAYQHGRGHFGHLYQSLALKTRLAAPQSATTTGQGSKAPHDRDADLAAEHRNSDQRNGETPAPVPTDDDSSSVFFCTLEMISSASIGMDVELSDASTPPCVSCVESVGIFSVATVKAVGPRGPPV